MDVQELKAYLPAITDPNLLEAISKHGKIYELNAGESLMEPGHYIKMVPLILQGSIKVMRVDSEGRELFLYYLDAGDSCALTLTCCSNLQKSDIKAVAEEKTNVIGIPLGLHEIWTNEYRQWKDFVALTYQTRFQELLNALDAVAFKKMDERLLNYLITKAKQLKTNELSITHQEIASELSTSREVISRLMKQLEKTKLIELGRNKVYVRDDIEAFMKRR
ncbi:Crp/Fnr family transcriptional regulator [Rhodocytophaga aerolata]|uniref:Crp/Fnr family transcriptional regulator n=1 Tax=Rhodocytophaga aerolata TaxID=455078 RepID=A0ABT8RCA8_9BACT|nr:Crp/Fnr family transcriptional regulator [Rhodocytophaga aerolata]MDO1448392.1 Crp/Fnr family transcriptional regulator [Rhodocytophaga aerolata]